MAMIRTACAMILLATAACGGDDDPVAYADLPAELADALCSYAYRCCDATELADQFGGFDPPVTDEASCRVAMTEFYQGLIGGDPAVASGRIRYDAAVAGTCVAAVRGATCGTSNQVFRDRCDAVFVGAVGAGGACADNDECAAGLCDQTAGAAEGTCVTPPTAGMACVDEACAASAYCEFQPATSQDLCVAKRADGELCTAGRECVNGYCDDAGRCGPRPVAMTCDGV